MRAIRNFSSPGGQQGLALIMAILIVALVAAVAVELSWRFDLSIARSSNRWQGMQAQAYLEGAENLAEIVLKEDMNDNEFDHLDETWAMESEPFPTDHGWVQGRIEDAQGRLNLNLLALKAKIEGKDSPEKWERYTASQRRFMRLLQTVNIATEEEQETYIDTAEAESITQAVMDWLDEDSEVTGFGGAESDFYEQQEEPLTIANSTMASVSELQVIRGITPILYRGLLPYVIALDPSVSTNVNTAPLAVMRSINKPSDLTPLSENDAQLIIDDRPSEGYETLAEFKDNPGLTILGTVGEGKNVDIDVSDLTVASDYFLFFSETLVGEHLRRSKSIIKRDRENDKVLTIRRTDANF